MDPEYELNEAFSKVGKEFGYDTVETEFIAYKEFKVRWQRSYRWARFKVSDYIMDASYEVFESLARTLFSKIKGDDQPYSKELEDFVTDPDFVTYKQPTYLRRSRNIIKTSEGEVKNLKDAEERLVKLGLIEKDPNVVLTWTKESNVRRVGYCSVLMKVVVLSKVLDSESIPDFVLDYVLYHEYLHLMIGFDPTGEVHSKEFHAREDNYPRAEEAENWLKRLCFHL